LESTGGMLFPIIPTVVEVKSGAVINQPQFLVPHQHICVSHRAVNIGCERIQPNNLRCQERGDLRGCRIESYCTRQEVQSQVETLAFFQQILYFFITFSASKSGIEMRENQFRNS